MTVRKPFKRLKPAARYRKFLERQRVLRARAREAAEAELSGAVPAPPPAPAQHKEKRNRKKPKSTIVVNQEGRPR